MNPSQISKAQQREKNSLRYQVIKEPRYYAEYYYRVRLIGAIGVLVLIGAVSMLPDFVRYMKIRSM
jgi:hypothetical protein